MCEGSTLVHSSFEDWVAASSNWVFWHPGEQCSALNPLFLNQLVYIPFCLNRRSVGVRLERIFGVLKF